MSRLGVSKGEIKVRTFLRIVLLGVLVLAVDFVLLQHFNTLMWPYLWPRPGIFILVGFFAIVFWFRELFAGIWLLRIIGLTMIFVGQSYLIHSFWITVEHFSVISLLHLIGVTGVFLVMTLNYINQINPKSNTQAPPLPTVLPYVAAVIPTYDEPREILEQTIGSLKQLDYPSERLYILLSDDGHRDEMALLATKHNIHYNKGARKDAKAGNLNSALVHLAKHFPQAQMILTQDADELIHPAFLRKTIGYFEDSLVAFVQTPKEAITPKGDPFGNRDRIFYDILQAGRNGCGAAFSCGSGVIWRITALRSVKGFATWNIVEDLTTSYFLHSAGYRSEYHNEVLTVGLSPSDIPGLLKQRGTWATDTWRLFLFDNPLLKSGLSLRQRLQYFELGMFYVASVFFIPLLMFIPVLSLATGGFIPIEGAALFPWIGISALYYITLARGRLTHLLRMWQYWVSHWPTYTQAFWIALRSYQSKPTYKVTRKTHQSGFYGYLIWAQFLYLFIGIGLILQTLYGIPEADWSARLTNLGILTYFMSMVSGICQAAFYGVTPVYKRMATLFNPRRLWQITLAKN